MFSLLRQPNRLSLIANRLSLINLYLRSGNVLSVAAANPLSLINLYLPQQRSRLPPVRVIPCFSNTH